MYFLVTCNCNIKSQHFQTPPGTCKCWVLASGNSCLYLWNRTCITQLIGPTALLDLKMKEFHCLSNDQIQFQLFWLHFFIQIAYMYLHCHCSTLPEIFLCMQNCIITLYCWRRELLTNFSDWCRKVGLFEGKPQSLVTLVVSSFYHIFYIYCSAIFDSSCCGCVPCQGVGARCCILYWLCSLGISSWCFWRWVHPSLGAHWWIARCSLLNSRWR